MHDEANVTICTHANEHARYADCYSHYDITWATPRARPLAYSPLASSHRLAVIAKSTLTMPLDGGQPGQIRFDHPSSVSARELVPLAAYRADECSERHPPQVQQPHALIRQVARIRCLGFSQVHCLAASPFPGWRRSHSEPALTWPSGRCTHGAPNSCSNQKIVGTVPPSRILRGLTPHTSSTADSSSRKYGESRDVSHHDAECVTLICSQSHSHSRLIRSTSTHLKLVGRAQRGIRRLAVLDKRVRDRLEVLPISSRRHSRTAS